MKIGVDFGHGLPGDIGAKKLKFEDELINDVGDRVVAKLQALKHEIVLCRPARAISLRDSLQKRVNIANRSEINLFVSIHFNAFNYKAHGSEVFATSSKGIQAGKLVLDEILKLGFRNRGVKEGKHLFVIKKTAMPAILIECCFCDSQQDMTRFNAEAMASAIVTGLHKYALTQPAE